jgi:hypothetical protein
MRNGPVLKRDKTHLALARSIRLPASKWSKLSPSGTRKLFWNPWPTSWSPVHATTLNQTKDKAAMTGNDSTVVLFRPVGPEELKLLQQSGFRRWPPRLPEQPIFYPVTNERYAAEIAERWNVKDSSYGAVTRFHVKADFMSKYPVQQVGASHHTEWWVPAEELEALNDHIVGIIEVIREFAA